jgi:hypothetical protein
MTFLHMKGAHVGEVLALLLSLAVSTAIAGESQTLTKKELKTLLATPKTSTDQQKLAAYYREKVRQLTAKAQDSAEHADLLATQPATIESKQGISCQCTSHYRHFSKRYAEEAKKRKTKRRHTIIWLSN